MSNKLRRMHYPSREYFDVAELKNDFFYFMMAKYANMKDKPKETEEGVTFLYRGLSCLFDFHSERKSVYFYTKADIPEYALKYKKREIIPAFIKKELSSLINRSDSRYQEVVEKPDLKFEFLEGKLILEAERRVKDIALASGSDDRLFNSLLRSFFSPLVDYLYF